MSNWLSTSHPRLVHSFVQNSGVQNSGVQKTAGQHDGAFVGSSPGWRHAHAFLDRLRTIFSRAVTSS